MGQPATSLSASSGAKSKAELAREFGASVKTFMRWLKSWNERLAADLQEPIDTSGQYFTPRDTRRIREQFA